MYGVTVCIQGARFSIEYPLNVESCICNDISIRCIRNIMFTHLKQLP